MTQVHAEPDLAEITKAISLLFEEGQTVELRAVDVERLGTVSG